MLGPRQTRLVAPATPRPFLHKGPSILRKVSPQHVSSASLVLFERLSPECFSALSWRISTPAANTIPPLATTPSNPPNHPPKLRCICTRTCASNHALALVLTSASLRTLTCLAPPIVPCPFGTTRIRIGVPLGLAAVIIYDASWSYYDDAYSRSSIQCSVNALSDCIGIRRRPSAITLRDARRATTRHWGLDSSYVYSFTASMQIC